MSSGINARPLRSLSYFFCRLVVAGVEGPSDRRGDVEALGGSNLDFSVFEALLSRHRSVCVS